MDTELLSDRPGIYEGGAGRHQVYRTHLSRNELAQTICEGIKWFAPNGKYKTEACLGLLKKLEAKGEIALLAK